MEPIGPKRVELLLPMRTVLIVAAAVGLMAAFVAIGETFLIVFVGIFLALVFEFPVRLVMAKTGLSRGLAATVTVLGAALLVVVLAPALPRADRGRRARLPPGAAADRRAAARIGRALVARRLGRGRERAVGRRRGLRLGARRDLRRARHRGRLLLGLRRRVLDPVHLPLPPDRRRAT